MTRPTGPGPAPPAGPRRRRRPKGPGQPSSTAQGRPPLAPREPQGRPEQGRVAPSAKEKGSRDHYSYSAYADPEMARTFDDKRFGAPLAITLQTVRRTVIVLRGARQHSDTTHERTYLSRDRRVREESRDVVEEGAGKLV